MKSYQYRVLIIFCALSFVLLQYQNCAASKGASLDASADSSIADSTADRHVINEVNIGGIQFTQSKTTVSSVDKNISVYGTCSSEQQGGQLSWQLLDSNGTLVFKGKALCDRGAFEVRFEGVNDLACGSSLSLKAFFGAQAKTETLLNKNCN